MFAIVGSMRPFQTSLIGGGEPAIAGGARVERLSLGGGAWIDLARAWLHGADSLLVDLVERVPWRRGRRTMYERVVDDPRLSRWYGPGDELPHPALAVVGDALAQRYGHPLAGPGINYYRDGQDSVAWHRDRELRRLDDTIVAIVALGGPRPFLVRPRGGGRSRDLSPASGDLLVMGGTTQRDWEHCVPKVARAGPRVSLSWRWCSPPATTRA